MSRICFQLGGTAVLIGLIEKKGSSLPIKIRLLSCDSQRAKLEEQLVLASSGMTNALDPMEGFPQKTRADDKPPDSEASSAGKGKATQPQCIYCPNPNPRGAKAALDAHFSGAVLMQVVLSEEGRVTKARIIRGSPYGLNQQAIDVLQNWRFKPATVNGSPITTTVMIELVFRTFR